MGSFRVPACALAFAVAAATQRSIFFATPDGGQIASDLYRKGDRGIVLAHGGRFDRANWAPQAKALATAGFRVLAIDFRGEGQSRGPGGSARTATLRSPVPPSPAAPRGGC